jgi:hypothetical protein
MRLSRQAEPQYPAELDKRIQEDSKARPKRSAIPAQEKDLRAG